MELWDKYRSHFPVKDQALPDDMVDEPDTIAMTTRPRNSRPLSMPLRNMSSGAKHEHASTNEPQCSKRNLTDSVTSLSRELSETSLFASDANYEPDNICKQSTYPRPTIGHQRSARRYAVSKTSTKQKSFAAALAKAAMDHLACQVESEEDELSPSPRRATNKRSHGMMTRASKAAPESNGEEAEGLLKIFAKE